MSRLFKIILILFALMLALYSACWFGASHMAGKQLAGLKSQYIRILADKKLVDCKVKFEDFKITGFPTKFNIELKSFTEEMDGNSTNFQSPLNLGYDMLGGRLFAQYSGDIKVSYEGQKYPEKIVVEDYALGLKFPLSLKMLKILAANKLFELVNFIGDFSLDAKKISITRRKDKDIKTIYTQDFTKMNLSVEKRAYYHNLDQIKNNIPRSLKILFSTKSNSNFNKDHQLFIYQLATPSVLFMNLIMEGKADINTRIVFNSKKLDNIMDNIDMHLDRHYVESPTVSLSAKGDIKKMTNNSGKTTKADLKYDVTFKKGYFANLKQDIKNSKRLFFRGFLVQQMQKNADKILPMIDRFELEKLEGTKIESKINAGILIGKKKNTINVSDLFIKAGDVSLNMTNDTSMVFKSKNIKTSGVVILGNYKKWLDILFDNKFFGNKIRKKVQLPVQLPKIPSVPGINLPGIKIPGLKLPKLKSKIKIDDKMVYNIVEKSLKSISNHPVSNSSDIAFDYKVDTSNLKQSKIGNWSLEKILKAR